MQTHADLRLVSSGPQDTAAIAQAVASVIKPDDVLVLGGDLGAGKTAFTKALGAALDIAETITSPTFTLAQRYDTGRLTMHHLDVYRIEQLDEVIDLALPELYESGGVVVIEWGDTIAPALPPEHLLIRFEFGAGDSDRTLRLTAQGPAWASRLAAIERAMAATT